MSAKRNEETVRIVIDVPRAAFVQMSTPPEWISQRTAERETGVGARSFLEDVGGPAYDREVIRRGKLRLTRRADYIAWLRERQTPRGEVQPAMDGADRVLAELGLHRVKGE